MKTTDHEHVEGFETEAHCKTIGQLADEFKISNRAIRFYEQIGLVTPVRKNNRRLFSSSHRDRIAHIIRLQQAGMTLSQIKGLCDNHHGSLQDREGEFTPSELKIMIDRLRVRRNEINAAIQEFEALLFKNMDEGHRPRRPS